MLGLIVGTTSVISIVPVSTSRVRMSLRFEPMMSCATGRPMWCATHPERMLPKFPVGTAYETGRVSVAPSAIADVT